MSIEFDRLDIGALTTKAQSGDGCAVREAITHLGFEERFSALEKIVQQSKHNKAENQFLPELKFRGSSGASSGLKNKAHLNLTMESGSMLVLNTSLYFDTLNPYTGLHHDECTDLRKPKAI